MQKKVGKIDKRSILKQLLSWNARLSKADKTMIKLISIKTEISEKYTFTVFSHNKRSDKKNHCVYDVSANGRLGNNENIIWTARKFFLIKQVALLLFQTK